MDDMTDMIDKILKVDKKTRELVESDEKLRFDSNQKVDILRREKHQEYLKKARLNMKVVINIEKINSEKKIKKIEEEYSEKMRLLEESYEKVKESLSNEIFFDMINI